MQSVLIVEDHTDARQEMVKIVTRAFGHPEICDVATLGQARSKLSDRSFDLIVLDLGLPDGNGEDFIDEILDVQPNAYIVISTIHDESDRLLKALHNGAKGYLLKEQDADALMEEFQGIRKGRPPLAPAVTRRMLEYMRQSGAVPQADNLGVGETIEAQNHAQQDENDTSNTCPLSSLTEREREVLVLIAKGFSRPEIAGFLNISKHTVAAHVAKIYSKLDISTRSEAAVFAEQQNLL